MNLDKDEVVGMSNRNIEKFWTDLPCHDIQAKYRRPFDTTGVNIHVFDSVIRYVSSKISVIRSELIRDEPR